MVTKSALWNQLAWACQIVENFKDYGVGTYLVDELGLQTDFDGHNIANTQAALTAWRASIGQLILNGQTIMKPIIEELGRVGYNSVESEVSRILDDIYDGMVTATETVKNRAWTFDNVATGLADVGGSNVGSGSCYRLVADQNSHLIENGSVAGGVVALKCIRDMHNGLASGREEFQIYGQGQKPYDQLDMGTCPGVQGQIYATRAHDGIISNPSFDTYIGTVDTNFTAVTDLTGWTLSAAANFKATQAQYYRREPGQTYGTSLIFNSNGSLYQYLADNNAVLDPTAPVFFIARYNRQVGVCDGTLTLTLGTQTVNVTLAAQTGWNDLVLGPSNVNKGWYDVFKTAGGGSGVIVKAELASRTSGYLLLDEIILAQPFLYDGRWYLVTAGPVDYLRDDIFSYTDSVANTGIIQYWVSRLYGKYFPHTSGVATYSDTPT